VRCACVDIGSNTTRLLVAEPDGQGLRPILSRRAFTRLRRHLGLIPGEVLLELAQVVAEQVREAREAGAVQVRVVATAAVRAAGNRAEVEAVLRERAGVEVEVLTGEEEARLAFLGATRTLGERPDGVVAVVDVGGASSEVVCGTIEGGVTYAVSLPVGSGALADAHLRDDPPTGVQLDAVRAAARDAFAATEPPVAVAAYAVGGSATSLGRVAGPLLDAGTLDRACRLLCDAPAAEVARRHDLHAERARILPAGMLLLEAASARFGLPLRIAPGGLREGVVLERLATSARP